MRISKYNVNPNGDNRIVWAQAVAVRAGVPSRARTRARIVATVAKYTASGTASPVMDSITLYYR